MTVYNLDKSITETCLLTADDRDTTSKSSAVSRDSEGHILNDVRDSWQA